MLAFLWVMHLNVGYNYIFLCHGAKECVRKQQPSYMSSPSYFAAYLMGFLQHFELEGPSNCEISRWVSRWSVCFAVVPYVAFKEVAHGMVCLSEWWRGVNFRDVICARRYCAARNLSHELTFQPIPRCCHDLEAKANVFCIIRASSQTQSNWKECSGSASGSGFPDFPYALTARLPELAWKL